MFSVFSRFMVHCLVIAVGWVVLSNRPVLWAAEGSGKADLVLEDFQVESGKAVEGEGIIFVARVKNIGGVATPAGTTVSVTFFDATELPDDSKKNGKMLVYGSSFKGPLAPGATVEIKTDAPWKARAGNYRIKGLVDDVRRIDDADRENNAKVIDITVEADPDLQSVSGNAEDSIYADSPNELVPNANFENPEIKPPLESPTGEVVEVDKTHALMMQQRMVYKWDEPDRVIAGADYEVSVRVKALKVGPKGKTAGMVLWNRLPVLHEPPDGGVVSVASWQGSFDWKHFQKTYKMPRGVSRFMIFFDASAPDGWSYLDDLSIRPVDDHPLEIPASATTVGVTDREQMTWIWNSPDFPWRGIPGPNGPDMGKDATKRVTQTEVWFRRKLTAPSGFQNAKATFVGDDSARLEINGKEVGVNGSIQDIQSISVQDALKSGENEVVWKVINNFGPGGLLGRIEWQTPDKKTAIFPTNGNWECSSDKGGTWTAASPVAIPAPASAQYEWCYPHLPKTTYPLTYDLPSGATGLRIGVRSPGSYRVLLDDKDVFSVLCSGHARKVDLSDSLSGVKKVTIVLEDIGQPAAGAGFVQVKVNKQWQDIPLTALKHDGREPEKVSVFSSTYGWATNVGSFEAAATRPKPNYHNRLEPWAEAVLKGAKPLFELGKMDDSSAEFGELAQASASAPGTVTDLKTVPRGLESIVRPEFTIRFNLSSVPEHGAAFVLGVEDADCIVTSVGVFVNGILSGMPQVLGYDQVPGGRQTNRSLLVTIPKERLRAGDNTLTLRILPSYYQNSPNAQNQSEEYIQMMGLGSRSKNPYKGSWLHWDYLALHALAAPVVDGINGRPIHMGTNLGYIAQQGAGPWDEYVVRDLSYLGLVGTHGPIRYSIWGTNQWRKLEKGDPAPDGKSVGEHQLASLKAIDVNPHLLYEPGRGIQEKADFPKSLEVEIIKKYGKYVDSVEVGNEVDEPYYGWDLLKLADAFSTLQRQAVCGQMLKEYTENKKLVTVGQGWYHAWDFSVIDAQARKEAPNDPAWTDELSAHDYAKSYIISSVGYYLLYGSIAPKPIWVTECGAWSADRNDATEFDYNQRGNIAFADQIIQYLLHPYNEEMTHFSLMSTQSKDALVMERARSYRRLLHTFGIRGLPLEWTYADPKAMENKLVYVNPVDTGKWIKVSFVNYSRDSQPIDVTVTLPQSGTLEAIRYGDAKRVAEGTRKVSITASPKAQFTETLAAGETVEYLIEKK